MQKGAIKAVVLTVIFFVAVGVFSMMTNHVNEDLTTEMKNATLPVITLESSEHARYDHTDWKRQKTSGYDPDIRDKCGCDLL